MSNISPKREAIVAHSIAVLSALLSQYLDEFGTITEQSKDLKAASDNMLIQADKFMYDVFQDNAAAVKGTTYIAQMSDKVDTVMRKNYAPIIADLDEKNRNSM